MNQIKLSENNYSLEKFSEMLESSKVNFSFLSGRKIVLLDDNKRISLHYNTILNQLLQIKVDSLTVDDYFALNIAIKRLQKLKDKGHKTSSIGQKIYNIFRRIIPNYFRENKIQQLENLILTQNQRFIFADARNLISTATDTEKYHLNLITLMDLSKTCEERANLLKIFFQNVNEMLSCGVMNDFMDLPTEFATFVGWINQISEKYAKSFELCLKKEKFNFLDAIKYDNSTSTIRDKQEFRNFKLEQLEKYFLLNEIEQREVLNSLVILLPEQKKRLSFLKEVKNLIKEISGDNAEIGVKLAVLEMMKTFPELPQERIDLLQSVKILMNGITTEREKIAVLTGIKDLPEERHPGDKGALIKEVINSLKEVKHMIKDEYFIQDSLRNYGTEYSLENPTE